MVKIACRNGWMNEWTWCNGFIAASLLTAGATIIVAIGHGKGGERNNDESAMLLFRGKMYMVGMAAMVSCLVGEAGSGA